MTKFTEGFLKASQAYWKKDSSEKSTPKSFSFAVPNPASQTDSILDALLSAADTPVVQPIEWPDTIPENHPIRQTPIFVCLWDSPTWAEYWKLSDIRNNPEVSAEDKEKATTNQYWLVIRSSTVTRDGKPVFTDATLPSRFDSPRGRLILQPIWLAGLQFNGLIQVVDNRDAKNSEPTTDSK